MLLPPQVPQPIESENGSPLSKLPPVAKQCAWSTMTRAHRQRETELAARAPARGCAGRSNARRPDGAGSARRAPPRRRSRRHGRTRAPGRASRPRTGDPAPTPVSPTIRNRRGCAARPVEAGARCAITPAACAMKSAASLPPPNIAVSSCRASAAVSSTPPCAVSATSSACAMPACAMTLFSDEQLVALSKVFERRDLGRRIGNVGGLVDDHRDVAGAHAAAPACRSSTRP